MWRSFFLDSSLCSFFLDSSLCSFFVDSSLWCCFKSCGIIYLRECWLFYRRPSLLDAPSFAWTGQLACWRQSFIIRSFYVLQKNWKRKEKEKAKPSLLPSLSYPPLHLNKKKSHSQKPSRKGIQLKKGK